MLPARSMGLRGLCRDFEFCGYIADQLQLDHRCFRQARATIQPSLPPTKARKPLSSLEKLSVLTGPLFPEQRLRQLRVEWPQYEVIIE